MPDCWAVRQPAGVLFSECGAERSRHSLRAKGRAPAPSGSSETAEGRRHRQLCRFPGLKAQIEKAPFSGLFRSRPVSRRRSPEGAERLLRPDVERALLREHLAELIVLMRSSAVPTASLVVLLSVRCLAAPAGKANQGVKGIQTPGIQVSMGDLKPEATIELPGRPRLWRSTVHSCIRPAESWVASR